MLDSSGASKSKPTAFAERLHLRGSTLAPIAHPTTLRGDHPHGYRLDVVTPTVADLVETAGGWLFDRGRIGWQLRIHSINRENAEALDILGIDDFVPLPAL